MNNDKKALVLYLVIIFSLSAIIETLWIIYGENATNTGISSLLMFIPFITAFLLSILNIIRNKIAWASKDAIPYISFWP